VKSPCGSTSQSPGTLTEHPEAIMTRNTCLLCTHFLPIAPCGWKPRYSGNEFDIFEVRRVMRENNGAHQQGYCTLNPVHAEVWTSHHCSFYQPTEERFVSLSDFIWGTWEQRESKEKEDKITELTRQLKASRKISNSRLKRIQRLTKRVKRKNA